MFDQKEHIGIDLFLRPIKYCCTAFLHHNHDSRGLNYDAVPESGANAQLQEPVTRAPDLHSLSHSSAQDSG